MAVIETRKCRGEQLSNLLIKRNNKATLWVGYFENENSQFLILLAKAVSIEKK